MCFDRRAVYPSAKYVQSTTIFSKSFLPLPRLYFLIWLSFSLSLSLISFPPCVLSVLFLFHFLVFTRGDGIGGDFRLRCGGKGSGFQKISSEGNVYQSQSKRKEHKTQKRKQCTTSVVSVSFPLDWQLFTLHSSLSRFTSLHNRFASRFGLLQTNHTNNRTMVDFFSDAVIFVSLSYRLRNSTAQKTKAMIQYFARKHGQSANRLRLPWCRHLSISVSQ